MSERNPVDWCLANHAFIKPSVVNLPSGVTWVYSKTIVVGESEELRLMAPAEAVEVADDRRHQGAGRAEGQRPVGHRAARHRAAGRRRKFTVDRK